MKEKNLKVGAGKSIIHFPKKIFPIENYSQVHDPLHTRVLLVETDIQFVIASFELTSIRSYEIKVLKSIISEIMHIPKNHIWICVTHTFSAPHTRSEEALHSAHQDIINKNDMLCEALEYSLKEALSIAIDQKQNALIGFGHGYCSVNVNSDVYTSKGWWLGTNDLGMSDKTVPIIRFDNLNHQPVALLYSYDIHSSVMDGSLLLDGTKAITSDLTGIASQHIEEQYDNQFVALYVVGAAGDQAPIFKAKHKIYDRFGNVRDDDISEDGFVLVNALGKKLGDQVILANEKIHTNIFTEKSEIVQYSMTCLGQVIAKPTQDIRPTHLYEYQTDGNKELMIQIVRFGYIVIIGIQPTINSITAMDIKKLSPFPLTMIVTMVNGGAKYMPDQTSYDRITYESMNSMFARGSAEELVQEITKQLDKAI